MTPQNQPLHVAFLIYDQVEVLDLNGPLDVFVKANVLKPNTYIPYLVSANKALVNTESNTMQIMPQYSFADCPKPDILVVPGANPDIVLAYLQDEQFQQTYTAWITVQHQQGALLFTVCTGSLLLSNTALFDGLSITTHFLGLDMLQERCPKAQVKRGVRFVDQDRVLTTAGITAGIDGALHLVGKHLDAEISQTIQQLFEYPKA